MLTVKVADIILVRTIDTGQRILSVHPRAASSIESVGGSLSRPRPQIANKGTSVLGCEI